MTQLHWQHSADWLRVTLTAVIIISTTTIIIITVIIVIIIVIVGGVGGWFGWEHFALLTHILVLGCLEG